MRKTLVTLALVAVSAVAANAATLMPTEATLSGGSATISTGDQRIEWDTSQVGATLENFMLTFSFDAAPSYTGQYQTAITVSHGENSWTSGLCVSIKSTVLTMTYNGAKNYTIDWDKTKDTLSLNTSDTYAFAYDSVNKVAYLMNLTDVQENGLIATGSAHNYIHLGADNTISGKEAWLDSNPALTSGTSTVWTENGVSITVDSVTDMTPGVVEGAGIEVFAQSMASVPEPATASLSLLGLAALMMRRRRA